MVANRLASPTPEQKAAMQAGRAAKVAARQASPLRRDFLDARHWEQLARALGVRLPPWGEPCTPRVMERFLRKVGRSVTWYRTETNERLLSEFREHNPTWPARAWAGIVLEMVAREQQLSVPDIEAEVAVEALA